MANLYDYFIAPIMQNGWFNPVNTITYAIVLVIAVFAVYKLLMKMNIRIDRYFFLAILPFIFWGSSARVLKDAATAGALDGFAQPSFASPFWVTPCSYIITFSLALFVLLAALLVQRFMSKRYQGLIYWKVMFAAGIALCTFNMFLMPIASFYPLFLILAITGAWALVFYLPHILPRVSSKMSSSRLKSLFSRENSGILSAHLFDASATFVALYFFGYLEQHVVPRMFIPFMGPAAMFFLKLIVVIPVLWLIDRYSEPGNFKNFLKISVLILGLAPGLRNIIRLMAGV